MSAQLILFGVLAALTLVSGLGMIISKNPVRSALCLVIVLFSVALLFLTLNAAFIAAIQIIVYAGAIMVLFLFVIMLLNLGAGERQVDRLGASQILAGAAAGVVVITILAAVIAAIPVSPDHKMLAAGMVGPTEIGLALYSSDNPWLYPFEVVSILLLVAAVGAIMLAKKRI
jgi:NADH-quinone oxidoreductase subunit J